MARRQLVYRPGARMVINGVEYVMRETETADEFQQRSGIKVTPPDDLRGKIIHRNQVMNSLKENPNTREAFITVYQEALHKREKTFTFMGVAFDWSMATELMNELYPGADIVDGRPVV